MPTQEKRICNRKTSSSAAGAIHWTTRGLSDRPKLRRKSPVGGGGADVRSEPSGGSGADGGGGGGNGPADGAEAGDASDGAVNCEEHRGHFILVPAYWSGTVSIFWQLGQRKSMSQRPRSSKLSHHEHQANHPLGGGCSRGN